MLQLTKIIGNTPAMVLNQYQFKHNLYVKIFKTTLEAIANILKDMLSFKVLIDEK